jgi:hypothetical protein
VKRLLVCAAWLAHAAASPEACAPCHRAQTSRFAGAGMTQALIPARDSKILEVKHSATIGGYAYELARVNGSPVLTVTDGKESLRVPLEWAFGQGSVGQTYLFQRDGRWYESRVSYYATLKLLDLTMGAQNFTPRNLLEAAGRPAGSAEAGQCFDCHATGVMKSPVLRLTSMREGVQCERCHGVSEQHLAKLAPMRKLGAMSSEETSEFCGQCHRTWSQIASAGPRGIQNVRFQPYRLAISKCYDAVDRRIACTACHDPHTALETSAAKYDAKCGACHSAAASTRTCKVATKECVTCHMPRLDLPGAHRAFTDHKIRIVRAGEGYPD